MPTFENPNDPTGEKTRQTLAGWFREGLSLPADAAVEVAEHTCAEPGCLHNETVFLVAGRRFKVPKPLVFIRKSDVLSVLKAHRTDPS